MYNKKRSPEKTFSPIEADNLLQIIDDEGLDALLKLIDVKLDRIGEGLLTEDLEKNSFAQLGIKHAKYQGAVELKNFILSELSRYRKRTLSS